MRKRKNEYIAALISDENHYNKKRAEELIADFENKITVIDGVVRWKSNDQVPPNEMLELWKYVKKPFDYEKSITASQKDSDDFLESYREQMANHQPSQEELFEMRAAFGPAETVINVITGQKIKL